MTNEYSWLNEPYNQFWNTKITVLTDEEYTLEEIQEITYKDMTKEWDFKWMLGKRNLYPITIHLNNGYVIVEYGRNETLHFYISQAKIDSETRADYFTNVMMKLIKEDLKK